MKKKLLFVSLLMLLKTVSFGQISQTNEIEPNNSFSTANEFLKNDLTTASLGSGDVVDFYGIEFNYNANLYIQFEVTNTGTSGTKSFDITLFNSLTVGGAYVGNIEQRSYLIDEGSTATFTILACGLAADSFYLKLESLGNFDYTVEWLPTNSASIDDIYYSYNNTPASASLFSFDETKGGSVGYEFWGNTNYDTIDYFKSILPAANYDSVNLKIRAQNNSCSGGPKWIKYFCYKNGSSIPFATGYVGDNSATTSFQSVSSIIPLSNMQQGDELLIKFVSNGAFGYTFAYKYQDIYDDDEDNCCIYNAIILNEGETKGGTVGNYDTNTDTFIDEYDTYRIIVPFHGAVNLVVEAMNEECTQDYYYLAADILDKFGNELDYQTLAYWENYPACNTPFYNSIKIRAFTADTFYIRLHSDGSNHGKINYTLRYHGVDSTGNIDVEPNNTFSTATPINVGEVKKGNVGFKSTASYDTKDFYKGNIPEDGNIKVYLKTTYRGNYISNNISLITNGYFTHKPKPHFPETTLQPDSVYIDTFYICGLQKGDISFELRSSSNVPPFEYEISYEITETSAADNDVEPNNSFTQAKRVGSNSTQKGHINFTPQNSANNDSYDFYKMVFTTTDSLKVYIEATNQTCYFSALSNRYASVRGYNKNLSQIFAKNIGNNTNVAPGQTVYDSIKIKVTAPDTIYLRFEANTAFKYQFTTNNRLPYAGFQIIGDTAVCTGIQNYKAANLADEPVTFTWSLPDGGGNLTYLDSIATVDWTTTGNRRIQLSISNAAGNIVKERTVIINGIAPTQTPVAYNFARTLSTNSFPPGTTAQWLKNDIEIAGATNPYYYAADAGSYTVKFASDCGTGPSSNAIVFNNAAQIQTIIFPHAATVTMSPTAHVKLSATSSSGLPVYYQKISGQGFIQNDTLFITGNNAVGTIIVKAVQPGDDVFSPAPDVYDTITVVKGNQVITFDSIPNQILNSSYLFLTGSSSAGLGITYSVIAGANSAVAYNGGTPYIYKVGAGTVTIRAIQNGNANYNAATPVEQTFCIGIRTLSPIIGDQNPCLATYRYTTQKIPGANFEWNLSGGGVLTTHNDTAWVQWQTPGSYTLSVKANSPCDPVYTNEQEIAISTSSNQPGIVSNMQPANNAIDQQLPLTLSWTPGSNTINYDLYLWDSAATEPITPYASNINNINYILPKNASLPYNRTYKWKIVAKNPCSQTIGPVQQFRLIPLPDLVVSNVQAPTTATSGQTITISWKVTNEGPGRTLLGSTWYDGVYFALDTVPNVSFDGSPNWNASSWSSLTGNGRPLLLGKKIRPSALESGQSYTSSLDFTLPLSYSFPVYIYVITDNEHPNWKILQVSVANDTAKKQTPMNISLAPTPDLRVDSVFAPTTTFSGSTINLTYKVKNYGVVTPAGVNWTDSIFISQNPLFDRSQCIPLTIPKENGSYYPNAVKAFADINSQLQPDSSYTKNVPVVIPNFIFGNWFIYVKCNAKTNTSLYEGASINNNIGQALMQVYLTPTPKLTINSLTVPVTSASTTQPIGFNWNIKNEGFTDNIETAKGHDLYDLIGRCPCTAPPGSTCIGSPIFQDHLILGSSYWLDRVYLSKDSAGLIVSNAILIDEIKHGTQPSMGLLYPDVINECGSIAKKVNTETALETGRSFPTTSNFVIPSDLDTGTYYVYVYTNPNKTVFEYPGTAQIKRSNLPITISRPDIIVPSITVPANSIGGQPINISYTIMNNGQGSVFSHVRYDQVFMSNFPAFDNSAQLISTLTFTENLPAGSGVSHSLTYNLPAAATGNRYFFVRSNYDSAFKETSYLNNLSASAVTLVSAAIPNDLVVSSVQLTDTVFAIYNNNIQYTVSNNGTGTTADTWTDSLFVSCNPVFNAGTSYFMGRKMQSRAITNGQSYTDTFNFNTTKMSYELNGCFPQIGSSSAYFFIKTNADNGTYEGTNINNNISTAANKIFTNPLVDHIVSTVSAADATTVGSSYAINWAVKNIGYNPNKLQYYYTWFDKAYFSTDSIADANDIKVAEQYKYLQLNRNQEIGFNKTFYTPAMPEGDYYVYVHTNATNSIPAEKIISNNVNFVRDITGAAKKIHVTVPPLSDLVDSIITAPSTVAIGQPITVIYKITNKGTGTTFPGTNFQNALVLSPDFLVTNNDGDRVLTTKNRTSPLMPGEFYYDTVTATIPLSTVPGNYVLISQTNSNNAIIEINENNNLGFSLLNVYTPPITDLTVSNVMKPDTVTLGYPMDTARWVVQNISGEQARGYSKDGIYLSAGNLFDSTAVLLGIKDKNILMQPLQSDTIKMTPMVTGVVEGNYNLFVKTDLLNNILESNKENNVGISSSPVYVKVKELQLNVEEPNTLQAVSRFYKLRIPDSLYGSTLLVTLTTADSLTMNNEMFIGAGYIPTAANYNYRFEIPNYGNQKIVMTDVTDSVYYIMYRCVSPNPIIQNVKLKVVKLPFAILDVHTNAGANIGNVTIRIKGSLFNDSMSAKLSKVGTTIYSSRVYYTNSGQVFATFNLQGKPLGIYDVTLIKTDLSEAVMSNGFSIVNANNGGLITGGGPNTGAGNGNQPGCDPGASSGLNSQLVVELVVPQRVLQKSPVVILINYSNPTNFDIPAQSRILYSEYDVKMAFTKAGVPTGTTSLYLELIEPDGPPDIIRAGGSGTIIIHTKAPDQAPEPGFVLFKLK